MSGLSIALKVLHLLGNAPIDQLPLCTGDLFDLLLHHVEESIVQSRHTGHNGRLEDSQVILELHDITTEEPVLHLVAHGAHKEHSLEDVSKRKVGDVDIVITDSEFSIEAFHASDVGNKVSVRQHDTLGHAGGARGVRKRVEGVVTHLI